MVISLTGRRSGKRLSTPVRYLTENESIYMFSSPSAQWWRNLSDGQTINVRLRGEEVAGYANLVTNDNEERLRLFTQYLNEFLADGVYHGLKLRRNQPPAVETLQATLPDVAIVRFKPSISTHF